MRRPAPTSGWLCEVCGGEFAKDEVYDDRGRIICKRCYGGAQGYPGSGPQLAPRFRERYDYPPDVPTHLAEAILVTLFCCVPFGIVAIVFAAQVSGKLTGGDYEGARQASQNAATWSWVAFGCGLAVGALYFFAMMAVGPGGLIR
jgi:hypothetical protein